MVDTPPETNMACKDSKSESQLLRERFSPWPLPESGHSRMSLNLALYSNCLKIRSDLLKNK